MDSNYLESAIHLNFNFRNLINDLLACLTCSSTVDKVNLKISLARNENKLFWPNFTRLFAYKNDLYLQEDQ